MKNIFPIFALVVMFFFCASILLRFFVKQCLIDNGIRSKFTDIIMFDVEITKQDDAEGVQFVRAVKKKLQINAEQKIFNSKNYNSTNYVRKKIENYTKNWLLFSKPIVQATNRVDFYSGNKILPNNVIDLGDGYLTETLLRDKLQNLDAFVQKIDYFKYILDSIDIPLVYVQYPHIICSEDNISKTGEDQNIWVKNELMQKLKDAGIPIIDLHKELHQRANSHDKEFHHSLFYKTDHHWQIGTVILTGKIISEKLNEFYDFGLEAALLDTANFMKIFVKKWLGSIGEKIIPLYSKEDFYIYSPRYATDINWLFFKSKMFESDGSFDSLYHFLSESDDSKSVYSSAYPTFSFSRNNNLPNGKKILLIGDSFNTPLSKFLALVFKEVNFIYRRSSLLDDYLANKPDVVVVGFDNAPFSEPLNSRSL